jgi:hypothetical protein
MGALALGSAMAAPPDAKKPAPATYFSIETGASSGNDFAAGSTIATVLSHPSGSVRCQVKSACGPEGLIAVALTSAGAFTNVRDIALHRVESALIPANIVADAYEGRGAFKADGPYKDLRVVGRLYSEPVQLVVAKGRGIKSLADLKRHTIAIDGDNSSTRAIALAVLAAAKLSSKSVKLSDASAEAAADLLLDHRIDGFFLFGPSPADVITRLAQQMPIELIDLTPAQLKGLDPAVYGQAVIPVSTYKGVGATETISVGMLWVVAANADESLVYQLASAVWDSTNAGFFTREAAGGYSLRGAKKGVPIPIHPGAERLYREKGVQASALQQYRANLTPIAWRVR